MYVILRGTYNFYSELSPFCLRGSNHFQLQIRCPFFCRLIVGLFLLIYFKKFFLWRKNNKKFRVGETRIRKIRHGRVTLNHDYSAALLGLYLNTMPYGMDKVSQDQGEIDLFWCKMVCCTQVPLHAAWLRLFRPIVG